MTNTKVSEVSEGGVALGENKFAEGQIIDEAVKAGEIVELTAEGHVVLCNGTDGVFLGVAKEHEEFDLDTDITSGKKIDVITEGYAVVFLCDINQTYYAGEFFYCHYDTPGSLRNTANGHPAAKLLRTINSGDTVAIVKLMR